MYQIWCKSENVKWVKNLEVCMGQTDVQDENIHSASRVYKSYGYFTMKIENHAFVEKLQLIFKKKLAILFRLIFGMLL